jgi:hypothetical protein
MDKLKSDDKITFRVRALSVYAYGIAEILMNHREKIDTAYGEKTYEGIADLILRQISDNRITAES